MLPVQDEPELALRDYLQIVRRRRLVVLLATVVVVGAALIGSFLQTPVYASSAEVLLQPKSTESIFDPNSGQRNDPQRALQTEIRILQSEPVKSAVRDKLGYPAGIMAAPAGQTDVIIVRGESTSPARAAAIANAYATSYIEFKRTQTVDDLLAAAQEVQSKIVELQKQIDAATGPSRDVLFQQQALFKSKLDELQVDAALRTGGAQLVTRAGVPVSPVRPQPLRTGFIALILGSLLGLGLAFLIDYLDDSVKTKSDLERVAPSLPVIGLIPAVSGWRSREESKLVSLSEPNSPAAEAYRTLRTSVQFLGLDRPVQSLQITSPNAQEGKTTTMTNLAVALARAGRRVVLVCCDLRRPRLHEFFGLSNEVGFTSVLLGEVGLSSALQRVPSVERLFVLSSGPLPPNPSELLSSKRTTDVLGALRADDSILLIDSPPVLPVTDALVLSKQVDATLLVGVAGQTSRKDLQRAVELLRQVDAPLVGAILNGVRSQSGDGYGYGYGYGYYTAAAANGNGHGNGNGSHGRRRWRGSVLSGRGKIVKE